MPKRQNITMQYSKPTQMFRLYQKKKGVRTPLIIGTLDPTKKGLFFQGIYASDRPKKVRFSKR